MTLTPEEIEQIAVRAAVAAATQQIEAAAIRAAERVAMSHVDLNRVVAEAVKQTLMQMGLDTSDPIEMQRDFLHLRQWRESGEDLKRKGTLALMGIFLSGLVTLVLLGLKEWFHK